MAQHLAKYLIDDLIDDLDLPEFIERVTRSRSGYLRWGRDTLGWAIYLFRKPG